MPRVDADHLKINPTNFMPQPSCYRAGLGLSLEQDLIHFVDHKY
jgi:hypothetical protein